MLSTHSLHLLVHFHLYAKSLLPAAHPFTGRGRFKCEMPDGRTEFLKGFIVRGSYGGAVSLLWVPQHVFDVHHPHFFVSLHFSIVRMHAEQTRPMKLKLVGQTGEFELEVTGTNGLSG